MSTSYHRLVDKVTHLRLEVGTGHDLLHIWVEHGKVGTLTLPKGSSATITRLFAEDEDDTTCPIRTHFGGSAQGTIITENHGPWPLDMVVVSDYGEIFTVAEVKAWEGAGRDANLPTDTITT